jgi:Na+-transporting NADH:ubiquinone oxidoreductase subunit B
MCDKIIEQAKSGEGFLSTQRSLLCAIDSFLWRPDLVTKRAPHIRDASDLKRVMVLVVVGLLPCTFFGIWNVGRNVYGSIGVYDCTFAEAFLEGFMHVFPLILISYTVGGMCEALFAQIKGHEIAEGFLVTGLLYPLVCPPTIPWWMFICGIMFGVIIGKEVFGGTGMNIMNPALLSRAFLFFAYPAQMSGDDVWVKKPFYENLDGDLIPCVWTTVKVDQINNYLCSKNIDVVSGQTPLALASELSSTNQGGDINNLINQEYSLSDMFLGYIPGSIGETSTLLCLVGACIIVLTNVASYQTIISVFAGGIIASLLFNSCSSSNTIDLFDISFKHHLVMGGFSFGAVFMATDPVSSPLHKASRWIYGLMIGMLCVVIRTVNPAYPEGMMLAILFINIFAPLIDHYVTIYKVNDRKRRYASE